MIRRVNTGDRIILFTLVDLLIQIIFCSFLLFAVNRAAQGNVEDKVAILARAFGVVTVTRYLDATTKLVAISDLGRVDLVATTPKSTLIFNNITKLLEGLGASNLAWLAAMDETQRRAFLQTYASLTAPQRQRFAAFVRRYGIGAVTDPAHRKLEGIYLSMTPSQRGELITRAQEILPRCFNGVPAFRTDDVGGGYYVSDPIREISGPFYRAVRSLPRSGASYFVSADELDTFGRSITSGFRCNIRVLNRSETNLLNQWQRLNQFFLLE